MNSWCEILIYDVSASDDAFIDDTENDSCVNDDLGPKAFLSAVTPQRILCTCELIMPSFMPTPITVTILKIEL